MLGRKGFDERLAHDPLQSPEMGDVYGEPVILDDAPKLRLIPVHDGEILVVDEYVTVRRFAVLHVGLAVLFDDFGGNPQPAAAVDFSPSCAVELVIGLLVHEFVAEEPCRLAGGVGYESFLPG